ncbi:peptidoglycan-recognition protein SC2 [Cryptotermes secundus]|uniref:peptidoglycan-recognition protein SC2 n=1 Tax=Cryptotermes secundus TaxID=105785 RepID=UPI001454E26B|nr:peptidoglycan-recognition protein SC2 [Cryptotermes secundus]
MAPTWSFLLLLGNFLAFGNSECPRIISKEEWGGRPPVGSTEPLSLPVPFVVVHHGGMRKYCTTMEECVAIVRSYQNYHIDFNGWNDIGYNFLVGEDGNVYEGRGWEAVGAHAPTYNTRSIGMCIIGDFTDRLPNPAALNALQQLIDCGVAEKKIEAQYQLIGHRQNAASKTECPGNKLFQEIESWPHWTPDPTSFSGVQTARNPDLVPEENNGLGPSVPMPCTTSTLALPLSIYIATITITDVMTIARGIPNSGDTYRLISETS